MRVNLPQFLERESIANNGQWLFRDTNDLIVRSHAQLGESWFFDPINGTPATITGLTQELIFGTWDSVRTLTTILDDTVKWSKDHGILLWHLHTDPNYELIGIQGPNLGQVVPSLEQFYRYQAGDVVQFAYSSSPNNHSWSSQERFHISQRTELPGRLEFTGYAYQRYTGPYNQTGYSLLPERNWVIDITSGTGPMLSAPNELVTLGGGTGGSSMICKHRVNDNGYYVIEAESFGSTSMFYLPDSISEECISAYIPIGHSSSYILDDQLGLRYYRIGNGPDYNSTSIVGAVINGDTVGVVSGDAYFGLIVDEPIIEQPIFEDIGLCPNPAMDWVHLPADFIGKELLIFDLQGRVVQNLPHLNLPYLLDVRALYEGEYLLKVDGSEPRRLVIAR